MPTPIEIGFWVYQGEPPRKEFEVVEVIDHPDGAMLSLRDERGNIQVKRADAVKVLTGFGRAAF